MLPKRYNRGSGRVEGAGEARWSQTMSKAVQNRDLLPLCVGRMSIGLRGLGDLVKMVFTDPS